MRLWRPPAGEVHKRIRLWTSVPSLTCSFVRVLLALRSSPRRARFGSSFHRLSAEGTGRLPVVGGRGPQACSRRQWVGRFARFGRSPACSRSLGGTVRGAMASSNAARDVLAAFSRPAPPREAPDLVVMLRELLMKFEASSSATISPTTPPRRFTGSGRPFFTQYLQAESSRLRLWRT